MPLNIVIKYLRANLVLLPTGLAESIPPKSTSNKAQKGGFERHFAEIFFVV